MPSNTSRLSSCDTSSRESSQPYWAELAPPWCCHSLCYQNTDLIVLCLPVGKDGGGCWQLVKWEAGGHLFWSHSWLWGRVWGHMLRVRARGWGWCIQREEHLVTSGHSRGWPEAHFFLWSLHHPTHTFILRCIAGGCEELCLQVIIGWKDLPIQQCVHLHWGFQHHKAWK